MIYRFAGVEFDANRIQLTREGATQKLGPRAYAFLLYLIENRDRVVPKAELLDAVWPDAAVSESALQQCAAQVRKAIGQGRDDEALVEAVYGQGYRFVAPVLEIDDAPASSGGAGPGESEHVVGRSEELLELNRALDRLEQGAGTLLLIGGPAGIGKTHLLRELSVLAGRRGVAVRHGRCHEQGEIPPYGPFAQALLEEFGDDPERAAPELAPIFDERRGASRERLAAHLRDALARIGASRPSLLLLDDMHRADAGSLALLRALASDVAALRWIVAVAHRRGGDAAGALEACAQASGARRLELAPLSLREAGELVRRATGREPSPATIAKLHERSGGNPFLASQLIPFLDPTRNTYSEMGVLERLPGSVREAVARQIVGLTPETVDVLTRASVLGRDGEMRVIGELCGLGPAALSRTIDEARSVGLIEESPFGGDFVRFAHTLIVEVLYENLSRRRAARLHARAADAIESASASPGPWLAEIARHRLEGAAVVGREAAFASALRAAEWSAERSAFDTAAMLIDRARALEPEAGRSAPWLALTLRSAELWQAAGDGAVCRARADEVIEACRTAGNPRNLARAALLYGGAYGEYVRGSAKPVLKELIGECLTALAGSPDEVDVGLRARLRARRATELQYTTQLDEVATAVEEARREAEPLADPIPFGHALLASAACSRLDELERAPAWAARAAAIGEARDDAELLVMGLHYEGIARFRLADFEGAYDAWERSAEAADETGSPRARYNPALVRGMRAVLGHRFDTDRYAIFTEARDLGLRSYGLHSELTFATQGLSSHFQLGGTREEFIPIAQKLADENPDTVAYRVSLASILLSREEDEPLAEQVDRLAAPLLAGPPADPLGLAWINDLAHMLVRLERREEAASAYQLMLPHAEVVNLLDWGSRGGDPTHLALGRLATLLGEAGRAIEHLERALELAERAAAPTLDARARAALGEALVARGTQAARARARAELEASIETAKRFGMSPTLRAAREHLAILAAA